MFALLLARIYQSLLPAAVYWNPGNLIVPDRADNSIISEGRVNNLKRSLETRQRRQTEIAVDVYHRGNWVTGVLIIEDDSLGRGKRI